MQQPLSSQVADLEQNHFALQGICDSYICILYRCYLKQIGEPYDELFTNEQLIFLETCLIDWEGGELTISNEFKRKKY